MEENERTLLLSRDEENPENVQFSFPFSCFSFFSSFFHFLLVEKEEKKEKKEETKTETESETKTKAHLLLFPIFHCEGPGLYYLPLPKLRNEGKFPKYKDEHITKELLRPLRPFLRPRRNSPIRCLLLISHRWEEAEEPDPKNLQFKVLIEELLEDIWVFPKEVIQVQVIEHMRMGRMSLWEWAAECRRKMKSEQKKISEQEKKNSEEEKKKSEEEKKKIAEKMKKEFFQGIGVWYDYSCLPQTKGKKQNQALDEIANVIALSTVIAIDTTRENKEKEKEKEKEINPKKNVPFVKRLWCLCEYFEALTYAICIIYVETEEISKQHLGTDVAIVNIKKPTGDALDNLPATTFVKMVEDLPKPDADEELTTKCHVLDVMRHALCVNSPSTYITVGFTLSFVLASVCLIVALFVESDVLWKLAVFLLIDGLLNLLLLIPFPRGGVFSFRLVLCVLVVPVIIYFRLEGGLVFFILFLLYILLRFLFSFCCLVIPFPLSVVSTGWLFSRIIFFFFPFPFFDGWFLSFGMVFYYLVCALGLLLLSLFTERTAWIEMGLMFFVFLFSVVVECAKWGEQYPPRILLETRKAFFKEKK